MNLKQTRLHILQDAQGLDAKAKTGVSLHCHTEHSKEMLDFIPHYADKMPVISYFWHQEQKKYKEKEGKDVDFSTSFWSPPMTGKSVYEIEQKQIGASSLPFYTLRLAATPNSAAHSGRSSIRRNASANAPASPAGTSRPVRS